MAAEERAHKIVERLVLEDEVTRYFLIDSVSVVEFLGKGGENSRGWEFALREGMKYFTSAPARSKERPIFSLHPFLNPPLKETGYLIHF